MSPRCTLHPQNLHITGSLTNIFLFPPHPSPWQLLFSSLVLPVELVQIPHLSEITQYLPFCVWLISLSMTSSRFIVRVVASGSSVVFQNECHVYIHKQLIFLCVSILQSFTLLNYLSVSIVSPSICLRFLDTQLQRRQMVLPLLFMFRLFFCCRSELVVDSRKC